MNVVDRQFAAAVVTTKGRQYVFDDLACMVQHVADGAIAEDQVGANVFPMVAAGKGLTEMILAEDI